MDKHVIIIGGGAAGFFCAVNAAKANPALRVTILEKNSKVLGKVKVSGGGRCNITHACDSIAVMSKNYPRGGNFVKKTFHDFFVNDTIEWFAARNVKLKAEADGRMFPITDSSQTIIDCLLNEANKYHVALELKQDVKKIFREGEQFIVETATGIFKADAVCIATGGFPKADMFKWITNLGHTIAAPVPSLFTFNLPKHTITQLMGVSVPNVSIKILGTKLEQNGPLLITHWGLSGPSVLRLSAWGAEVLAEKNWQFDIMVNWLPAYNEQTLLNKFQELRYTMAANKLFHKNPFGLPARLWEYWLHGCGIVTDTRWADLPAKLQNVLIKKLCACQLSVQGKTTFKEEFVTAGGVNLHEIDTATMQSKIMPGLYFAGEVINVDGITGGYNFQHAWTTGYIAAKNIANKWA